MDNIQTLDYVTIPKKEYMELLNKKLNYRNLLSALLQRAEYNPLRGGLEFDQLAINHVLCALETDEFYSTLHRKESEYKEEMERLKNVYGNNQSNQ